MDKITHEDSSPLPDREFVSPLSPKRLRMDYIMSNNHCGKRTFDFPELLTFQKTVVSPSSKMTLQKNMVIVCTAESGDLLDEQPQVTKLVFTPITTLTNNVPTRLMEVCFIGAESHLPDLGKHEQLPLTETDKLSSNLLGDTDEVLAKSHTSEGASADTSSHPDSKSGGKLLEDEPPGGCCLPAGDANYGTQVENKVQNNVSQIQAFTLRTSDEEVKCQSDCTYEYGLDDAGVCDTQSQSAQNEACNQLGLCDNTFFREEEEEGKSHISLSDFEDSKSFYSNPKESGNLAECAENEEKLSELQIYDNQTVAACDGKTKCNINRDAIGRHSIPSVAGCVEGSTVSYDVILSRNVQAENFSAEVEDFCGAEGENAASKIAKAWREMADHTTPMPSRTSQECAEGDNDSSPFSVIDPAIWSETDREAEEKCSNSDSSAGVELSPSLKVCVTETPLPLCFDVWPSHVVPSPGQTQQLNQQSTTQQYKDEKEDLCPSYTEPQAHSISVNETHKMTGNESSSHWKSSPSSSPQKSVKPLSAGEGRYKSLSSVRHMLKEQDQSSCLLVCLDHLRTHQVEYSQTATTEIKDTTSFMEQKGTEEYDCFEMAKKLGDELKTQNEPHKENTDKISNMDDLSLRAEGKVSESDVRQILIKDVAPSRGKEEKEGNNFGDPMETYGQENEEILVKTEEDLQQQNDHRREMTEFPHLGHVSTCMQGNASKSGNRLNQVSQCKQGDQLTSLPEYQDRAEAFILENKDELLGFTSAPTVDAVVPCRHDFCHSEYLNKNPAALNCNDRFPPVPSAFTFYNRALGGFDTFEKIQLSPDGDDEDAVGLDNSSRLTSLPRQLLKTSERQLSHSMPGAATDTHREIPGLEGGTEEVERCECHIEPIANEFLSSDSTCNELPNFMSKKDIIALGCPEQQLNCELACVSFDHILDELKPQSVSSTVSTKSNSSALDETCCPQFEMKSQFDIVLKELNLFFDININEFASNNRASSPERCSDVDDVLDHASHCKEHLSSPDLGGHRDTSSDTADEDSGLQICGGDAMVLCSTGSCEGEQEVPLGNQKCLETPKSTAEKHREPGEQKKMRKWSPSFMCPTFLEQLKPPEHLKRLEPLRTCTRPIRVGLSKRARTKHLHHPHPYK